VADVPSGLSLTPPHEIKNILIPLSNVVSRGTNLMTFLLSSEFDTHSAQIRNRDHDLLTLLKVRFTFSAFLPLIVR
jgi:hypothetical protein